MHSLELWDTEHPKHEATRRSLVRKLDWHVLPGLSLLWLACFIDRTNIGNAKVGGMDKSLGLYGNQYNICLAVFYITYIASELPSNYMLKRVGGKIWLPLLVASWGIVTIFSGFMQNYVSLLVVRLLLGLFEGGLLPGMVFYLSTMYKRDELQLRVGVFFAFASLSGAFGGLLAYGIERMEGVGGKKGWQWIFFLEGMATVLIALFALYYMPTNLQAAHFLTEEERQFAVRRLKTFPKKPLGLVILTNGAEVSSLSSNLELDVEQNRSTPEEPHKDEGEKQKRGPNSEVEEGILAQHHEAFEKYEFFRGLTEPQVWLTGIGYMSLCVGLYSYSLFLPTIVLGMGHSGTEAQLFSSFPYLPASVLVVVVAFLSDKFQLRASMVVMLLPITVVGYILAIVAETNTVRYAAVFLISAGMYPSVPAILCILPSNTASLTKRNVATALQLMIANCAGFIATFIYTPDQAPQYIRGHTIALSFSCLAWIMLGLNGLYCVWENRARALGYRDSNIQKYQALVEQGKTKAPIGDREPSFRMTL